MSGLQFPKPMPRVVERHKRRKDADKALTDAYAEVDARDGGICLVTGRYTSPGAPDARVRREHHHLKGRNVKPEWVTVPKRIVTVCKEAHDLLTGHALEIEGTDATKELRVHWNDDVLKPKDRPFEIRQHRKRVLG